MSDENNTWFLEKLRQRAEAAEARVKELEAERSAMANHVLVEDERHDRLLQAEAENIMLRRELSLISHLHPGPGEPGSIARRAIAANKPDDELARLRQLEAVLVHCNTRGLVPPLSPDHQSNALSEYRRTVQAGALRWAAGQCKTNKSALWRTAGAWLEKQAAAIRRGEVEI